MNSPCFDHNDQNPLDVVEVIIENNEWPYQREGNDEIVTAVRGEWCDFHIRYDWKRDQKTLKASAMIDLIIPDHKRAAVLEAMNLINERLDAGHFSIWNDSNIISFNQSHMLGQNVSDNVDAYERLTLNLISEANEYYPIFQFVIESGKSADEAIDLACMPCMGQA
jgi:hypothetical protein